MDSVRGFEDDRSDTGDSVADDSTNADTGVSDTPIAIGGDERRMHVRAYNHWVSLLGGRAYPSIEDLDPASITDFGPHSVLLDFTAGIENPAIAYLGRALREECGLDLSITHIAQVPSRSLLSRLTDHYLQIIANRAPIGFEAEFIGTRGFNTLYRGILMPFSSNTASIDFIFGVINWKELVDPVTEAALQAEVAAAVITAPAPVLTAPIWADGPGAGEGAEPESAPGPDAGAPSLGDQLVRAQQTAAAVRTADSRSRVALYQALCRAHDFAAAADADPIAYEALLNAAGIAVQLRAPMTPIVKLVFGSDYDKTRVTEYAAVLAHARRIAVPTGALGAFLDGFDGGIKGVVRAERAARAPIVRRVANPAAILAERPTLASLALASAVPPGGYVVLLACAKSAGMLDIVAAIDGNARLTERVMRSAI